MKYAVQFAGLSAAAVTAACFATSSLWLRVVFVWIAIAMAFVAVAYAIGRWPVAIKRGDGSQPIWARIVLWPYFGLAWISFAVYRLMMRRTVATAQAAPGLWFSRRITSREARATDQQWHAVLDLAAEFPRIRIACAEYRSMPLLDAAAPTPQQLLDAVTWIDEQLQRGPVLVHCALGHGRTGCVVLSWMFLRGYVSNLAEGIAHLRKLRTSFGISASQAACIERLLTRHHQQNV